MGISPGDVLCEEFAEPKILKPTDAIIRPYGDPDKW